MILNSIKKSEEEGIVVSDEMAIDLHFAWKKTLQKIKKDLVLKDSDENY